MKDSNKFFAAKLVMKFSLPIVAVNVMNTVSGFVAMLFVAHLGHAQLAASALVTSLQTTFFVIAWAFLFSVSITISHARGADKPELIGCIVRQSWVLSLLIGFLMIVLFLNMKTILFIFHQPTQLVNLVQKYFYGLSFGVIPSLLSVCLSQFLTGVGKPRITLLWGASNFFLTTLLGYGFLFGKFYLPQFGMEGMAYAISTSYSISLLILIVYLYKKTFFSNYKIFEFSNFFDFEVIKKLTHIGWPICAQFGVELLAFSFATIYMGWLSDRALAAQQIVNQINLIAVMIPYGIAQANAALIGHAIGEKRDELVRDIGFVSVMIGLIFSVIVALIYLFLPKPIIGLYLNIHDTMNEPTVYLTIRLLAVMAFAQVADSVRNIITGSLRGFRDTKIPMLVALISNWFISLPLGYLMAFTFHFGAVGVRAGFIFGFTIGAIWLVRRFHDKTNYESNFGDASNRLYRHAE